MVDVTVGNVKWGAARGSEFDVWTIAGSFGGARRSKAKTALHFKRKERQGGEMPQQAEEDDEMGVGSCPLPPCHCGGARDGDYVTRAPPPACCTHPTAC